MLPSLLLCDFANLEGEVRELEAAGTLALHFDVMDGHFVPNFTYGLPIVESLRTRTDLVLDVHLMIEQPDRYVEPFYEAGADVITIHAEAVEDARPTLEKIRTAGALAGLAINPTTPLDAIDESLSLCDLVLVMSVMPGFGGQAFDESALNKMRDLRSRSEVEALLEVDGGVNLATIGACAEAGAELLVVGSAIFRSNDYSVAVSQLTELARSATTV